MLLFAASMTLNAARKAARAPASDGHASTVAPLVRWGVPPYIALPEVGIPKVSVIVMAYIGFATGMLSGLLGIGGGVALLPVLVYGYGFSIKDAAGTGILLLFATVLVGTFEHALRHNVDLRVALAILAGSSVGSQLGARTTSRVSNQTLRIAFAVLLLGTVGAIGIDMGQIAVVNRRQFLKAAAGSPAGSSSPTPSSRRTASSSPATTSPRRRCRPSSTACASRT